MIQIQWGRYDGSRDGRPLFSVPTGTHQNTRYARYSRLIDPPGDARTALIWVGQGIEYEVAFSQGRTWSALKDPLTTGFFEITGPERNVYPRRHSLLQFKERPAHWPRGPYGLALAPPASGSPTVALEIQPVIAIGFCNYLYSQHSSYDEGRGFKPGRLVLAGAYWYAPIQPVSLKRRSGRPLSLSLIRPHAPIGAKPPSRRELRPRLQEVNVDAALTISYRYQESVSFARGELRFATYTDAPIVCEGTPRIPLLYTNMVCARRIRGGAPTRRLLIEPGHYYDQLDFEPAVRSRWFVDQSKEFYHMRYRHQTTIDDVGTTPVALDPPGAIYAQAGFLLGSGYVVNALRESDSKAVWGAPYLAQSVFVPLMEVKR